MAVKRTTKTTKAKRVTKPPVATPTPTPRRKVNPVGGLLGQARRRAQQQKADLLELQRLDEARKARRRR